VTPTDLASIVSYLNSKNANVVTMKEGLAILTKNFSNDTIPPEIAPVADITTEAVPATSGVAVTYTLPIVNDNIDTGLTPLCVPSSGSLFPTGTNVVTCRVADTSGNVAATTFKVIVPVIVVPPAPHKPSSSSSGSSSGSSRGDESEVVITKDSIIETNILGNKTEEVLGASTGYQFTRTLMRGLSGEDITQLQNRLTSEGIYIGPITGYFGLLTEVAVKAYQTKNGIEPIGVVGPKTRTQLNSKDNMTVEQMKSMLANLQAQLAVLMAKIGNLNN
jgi:hypothetical protein